jgi:tRNA pseudouridine55 synthase
LKTSKKFIGEILQKPPMYSAIKKNGVRLYKLAREGKKINREKRKVIIEKFEITSIKFPEVSFSVTCSKGTYIRSLVDDYGKELLSGAHLTWLRRTNIGDFSVNNSVKVMEFIHKI